MVNILRNNCLYLILGIIYDESKISKFLTHYKYKYKYCILVSHLVLNVKSVGHLTVCPTRATALDPNGYTSNKSATLAYCKYGIQYINVNSFLSFIKTSRKDLQERDQLVAEKENIIQQLR